MKETIMSIYETITSQIIEALESAKGGDLKLPWQRSGVGVIPRNALTKKAYRGINHVILYATAENKGYESSLWATFKQWQELGATVKKGEKSSKVIIWKECKKKGEQEGEGEERGRHFFANAYCVFNVSQVEGYQLPIITPVSENEKIEAAERFFSNTGAKIEVGGEEALYRVASDVIKMPPIEVFRDSASFYSVLAHETTHWSGASSRINRDLKNRFGSRAYAAEELIAELGAAFICAELELTNEPRLDHAQYIASWIKVLKEDPKAIFTAASKAQQAVDYLNSLQVKELQQAA